MRFPGDRNPKHYFPVTKKETRVVSDAEAGIAPWYVLGLDEVLVDVEVRGSEEIVRELGLINGESVRVTDEQCRRLLQRLQSDGVSRTYSAGGTVANTLNNYTYLSGEPAILMGAIEQTIVPGGPAFAYVAQTAKAVDLSYLLPLEGPTGTAVTHIGADGERSFGVAPGVSQKFPAEAVRPDMVQGAALVVASLYCFASPDQPIAGAATRVLELAHEADVPVAFGLGTAGLVRRMRDEVQELLERYVTVAAMNTAEAEALTGHDDALLACQALLDWVDVVIVTEGPRGLTMAGWTDESVKRETREKIHSKTIPEYNRWEFSRLVRRRDCSEPLKIYSHIHPYRGGPDLLHNTNGAGDAALAALLHDVTANHYHRARVPDSLKHAEGTRFLSYSSLSRNAAYGNRVAYEVLQGRSPRLEGAVGHDEDLDS